MDKENIMSNSELKEGQEVWVKGVVDEDGNIDFRENWGGLIEYLPFYTVDKVTIRTDEKVAIPKFVADWIEETKKVYNLYGAFGLIKDKLAPPTILGWFSSDPTVRGGILARAWLEGYTIEQEKLYTVEIPNPNIIGNEHLVLMKNGFKQIVIVREFGEDWQNKRSYQLTESEIKEDFAWAWDEGFAKEV